MDTQRISNLFNAAMDSQQFWGVVTLILTAAAFAGRQSVNASNVMLALAWVTGCVGLYRTGAFPNWYILAGTCFAFASILFFYAGWLHPPLKPFVIDDSFLTLVPFNTGPGLPIPYFLNDFVGRSLRDMNDPIHRYPRLADLAKDAVIKGDIYNSLQQLQQLLDAKKPVSDEERRKLLAEVLQYYIIERIDIYQSDYNAAIAILGSGKGVSHRRGNHPPDRTQYAAEDFLAAISVNSLSQFAFIERFRFSPRGYWVPRGTKITLENTTASPTELRYVFTLHNPNVYLLRVAIEKSSFGPLNGLPSNYQTTADINPDLVFCYSFIIKWHFEYYRRTDTDSLEQEQYTRWAESLFSSLKEHLDDG